MLEYISKDLFCQLPAQIADTLTRLLGKSISDSDKTNEYFTIGAIINLINKHVNEEFHIRTIYFRGFTCRIDAIGYTVEDVEMCVALWKALIYCYDDEKRQKELEEKEKIWNQGDNELVNIRYNTK